MKPQTTLEVPQGYRRGIRFGALWTLITSPYLILYFILMGVMGGANISNPQRALELAGNSPVVFSASVLLDGLFHVLFCVTAVTLYAVLRSRLPVRASVILASGFWQMIAGFTKGLSSYFILTRLGSLYMTGDAVTKAMLIPLATGFGGLRDALQWMDSLGVIPIWIILSLLPSEFAVPRVVRWLGWILVFGVLGPDPAFILVVLLAPVWLFSLGRWLKRLAE